MSDRVLNTPMTPILTILENSLWSKFWIKLILDKRPDFFLAVFAKTYDTVKLTTNNKNIHVKVAQSKNYRNNNSGFCIFKRNKQAKLATS